MMYNETTDYLQGLLKHLRRELEQERQTLGMFEQAGLDTVGVAKRIQQRVCWCRALDAAIAGRTTTRKLRAVR